MDLSKMPLEDKDKILGIILNRLVWIDQYMGHGHWEIRMEPMELFDVAEILDKTFLVNVKKEDVDSLIDQPETEE